MRHLKREIDVIFTRQDGDDGEMRIIASTSTSDRMGDIVDQSWLLDNFNANPVMLWAHDPSTPPVGRALDVRVEEIEGIGQALTFRPKFDEGDHNPLANTVAEQFRNGTLNTVSVGFRPGSVTPRSALGENHPKHAATGMVLAQNELLEISAVTIPANAEALAIRSIEEPDAIADAVKEALANVPELVLEAVRNDPEIRAAIVGHIMAQEVEGPSVEEYLRGLEPTKVLSVADYLAGTEA